MKKNSGCNSCTHPTCPHSLNVNGISSCVECEFGVLVLDPSAAPKWKVGCNRYNHNCFNKFYCYNHFRYQRCLSILRNRCDIIITVFDDAQKVSVEDSTCQCGAQMLNVEYRPEKTKFPDDKAQMLGCMFCTAEFIRSVHIQKATFTRPPRAFRGGRTMGGRVGGGRGRSKPKQPKDKMAQLAAYFV